MKRCKSHFEQVLSEKPLRREILTYLLSACLLFISLILPAAADDDFTLHVFGNANMDDRIDDSDLNYVESIISKNYQPTVLADANCDGTINETDLDQIKKLISETAESITIIDYQNRNVTLNLPIERAVGINIGAIEIMRAIGIDIRDVFVAVTSYALSNPAYFPELDGKIGIELGNPDYEKLFNLNPDLVILYKDPYKEESFGKYDAIGVPVICIDCFERESLGESIKILAEIFGKRDNAQDLLDWYYSYIDLIKKRTDGLDLSSRPKTIFCSMIEYNYPAIKVCNKNSGNHWLIVDAGGNDLGQDLEGPSGVAEVDREWILSQNPEVIVGSVTHSANKSGYSANESLAIDYMRTMHGKLVADEVIKQTDSAAEDRIHIICVDLYTGPMQAAGTAFMAKILYPETFEDLNPEEILREYFEDWQGIPYRGVWIYPPMNSD